MRYGIWDSRCEIFVNTTDIRCWIVDVRTLIFGHMKKLQYYLTFALLCLMTACNPRASQPQFEFQLFDQDGSLSYSKIYTLTNSHLSITIRHGLTSDQDSTVFVLAIPSGNLIIDTLSRIDFSSLNENYSSDCIEDGTLLDLYIKRDGLKQHVHITNYYLKIGRAHV